MDAEQFYFGMPVVTRTILTLSLVLSVAVTYEVVTPLNLIFSPTLIFQEKQYWRILTSLLFFDRLSVNCLFHLHFFYMFSRRLEEHFFLGDSLKYLYTLGLGASGILLSSSFLHIPFPSGPLVMMVLYLWSRRYPDEQMSIYFIFTVSAPYLPLVMMFLTYTMSGNSIQNVYADLAGVAVGHVLWYCSDVLPKIIGFDPTALPGLVRAVFS
jgi:Derlin-2/3